MNKKRRLIIMMAENGKSYSDIARRVGVSRQRVSIVMSGYYKSPRGKRSIAYKLKRYFCEVCGQPRTKTVRVDNITVEMCNECAITITKGDKRYYPNRFDWSIDHPECIDCQSTKYHHVGHGRCSKCYPKYKEATRIGISSSL